METAEAVMERTQQEGRAARVLRLLCGAVLVLLVVFPLYRLLDPQETGPAGSYTVGLLDIYYDFSLTGLLLVLPVAIIASRLVSPALLDRWASAAGRALLAPGDRRFAVACALVAALITAAFSVLVLDGKPNLIDAFAQILQARYWASGMLAGPADAAAPFWGIQNALFTPNGWVSQYPPGHVLLLVPFLWLGVPWMLGPVLVFVTVFVGSLLARLLFEDDPITARVASGLFAVSPFFLFISASLMNHVTTAACVTVAVYALLRAAAGSARWGVLAGALFALSLANRPLSTLAMGVGTSAVLLRFWWPGVRHARRVTFAVLAGAAPVLVLWFAYNAHFFGSPFRLGYDVALGPSMGLGFHRDPWGNRYGPGEALAYTSSDLITLGVNLFETPVSAVLVVGAFLLFARSLPRAAWLLLAWGCVPVLANALYWHHGLYMGPRMLHEAAPAWILLFACALVGVGRRIPAGSAIADRYFLRPAYVGALAASFLIGFTYLAPRRAASYGGTWISIARTPVPETEQPSLVFVHDAWNARIAMSLAATGMRLDLIETLVRQNPTCRVDEFVRSTVAGDTRNATAALGALDTIPRANRLPIPVEIAPGDGMRVAPNEILTPECEQQALSDRFGIIDIAPLLWQADLHGADGDGVLIVRDLGPERNRQMLTAHSDREPYVYVADSSEGGVRLLPYDKGMRELWFPPDTVQLRLRRQVRPFEQ